MKQGFLLVGLGLVAALGAACGDSVTTSAAGTATGSGAGMSTASTMSDGPSTSTGTTGSTSSGAGGTAPEPPATSVDLLLMIDNSRSMADKQQVLAAAVPDLVNTLVNPACVDANGVPAAQQPASPVEPCPSGTHRGFSPVLDLHIGIVTSSLGGHGSDACNPATLGPQVDDHGELVHRAAGGGDVPTYQTKGFLAWDPAQQKNPPGEANAANLVANAQSLVVGAGQSGCGFESQLESWYRFLVDPKPYKSISVVGGKAQPNGVDATLLQERADFLRPDSLLVVLMLTDENDCSTKEYSQFYLVNQVTVPGNQNKHYHLPRPREECDTNPADKCCASCGQNAPAGCPASQRCMQDPTYDDLNDNPSVRCWDNKRRFGIDFLYPLDRYVQGLTASMIPDEQGNLVANPIFANATRGPQHVLLAGVLGVPWQDLARDPNDVTKGLKSASELATKDANGHTGWEIAVGDPSNYIAPIDPLMHESNAPRSGTNPATGSMLAPPGGPAANPVNGKEVAIPRKDDLEFACVFDLPMPRDCSDPGATSCDCQIDPGTGNPPDSPLCNGTTQIRAKAYPSLRELAVIQGVGAQGVPGSICPKQLGNPSAPDFGYRQLVSNLTLAITDRLVK